MLLNHLDVPTDVSLGTFQEVSPGCFVDHGLVRLGGCRGSAGVAGTRA